MKKFLLIDGAMAYTALVISERKIFSSAGVVLGDSAGVQQLAPRIRVTAQ